MATEQRKSSRRSVNTDGFLYAADGRPLGACHVEDVSVGGAKLAHTLGDEVPSDLVLLLSRNGRVRRHCQVAWRGENRIGVRFIATGAR